MGNQGNISAIRQNSRATDNPRFEPVLVPKDYLIAPVFAACKQTGSREVTINERRYQIGGFHPMRPELHPPALDVRHARAIFALLTFRNRERNPHDSPRLIRFSFNEFCRKYANSNGGHYARAIVEILADLMDSYIRVTDVPTGVSHEYRLIEHVDIEKRPPRRKDAHLAKSPQLEIFFNGCTLSPEFEKILDRITELQHLRLDVLTGIRSPLAQAIYLYIPSRAYHHTEDDPFEITITKLLEQISSSVPSQKNRRHQLFTQNKNPIIKQLDGLPTLTGIFRVRLVETADRTDWKLQTWVERNDLKYKRDPQNSKLMTAFLASGQSQEDMDSRLAKIEPLSDHEFELLEMAGVEIVKNLRFFGLAKALLGATQFVGLLAEAKGDALEGRKAKKNPTARLIWRVMAAFPRKSEDRNKSGLADGAKLRELFGNRGENPAKRSS